MRLDPNYSLVCTIRGWTFLYTLRWTNDAAEGVPSPTCNSSCHLRGQGSCHILHTPPRFLFRKEASGPEMSSEGNATATLSCLLTHPLILLEHLPGHPLCWPEKNHQLFQVFPGTHICERASNDAAVNAEPECMHSNTQWKFLWLFLYGIHMFIFFIEIEGTIEYLLSLKTCLGASVGNYFSNGFVFHTYLLFSIRSNWYMQ